MVTPLENPIKIFRCWGFKSW